MAVDANFVVNLQLPLGLVNQIVESLADKPLRESFTAYMAINGQVEQQVKAHAEAEKARTVDNTAKAEEATKA